MITEIDVDHKFKVKLKKLMKSCPLNQEKEMGFPKDWNNHPFWN
jgi:hypothetical protein